MTHLSLISLEDVSEIFMPDPHGNNPEYDFRRAVGPQPSPRLNFLPAIIGVIVSQEERRYTIYAVTSDSKCAVSLLSSMSNTRVSES